MILSKQEIIELANNELKKYNLKTKIKFLNQKQFKTKALLSPLISQSIKEGNTLEELNIPALVSHKTNTIYISKNIISNLMKNEPLSIQERFIKSIILHEISHLRSYETTKDFNMALRLEEEAARKFKKEYPALATLGRRICKKYISN